MKAISSLLLAATIFAQDFPIVAPDPFKDESRDTVSTRPSLSFLIPAEGDVLYTVDVKIVAYARGPSPAAMLAVLDGFSLDRPLHFEEGILKVDLPPLKPGAHEFKMLFLDDNRQIQLSRTVRFFVRVSEPKRDTVKGKFRQFGRILTQVEWKGYDAQSRVVKQSELEIRHDSLVAGKGIAPLSRNLDGGAEVTYTVKDGFWEGHLRGLVRTDDMAINFGENQFRQSSDRFSGSIAYGPWVYVKGGDLYPTYNPLILNGTRIRGGEAGAAVVIGDGTTHLAYAKIVTGESKREVPASVVEYDTGGGVRFDTLTGTHAQKISAFRLGAGGGRVFDLGVTIMKAYETGGDSLSRVLNDNLNGVRPVDNLVMGTDLRLGFWEGRIQVFGQCAISLFTRDRSLGAFAADSFGVAFNPNDFKSVFIFNPTTSGWQYLLRSGNGSGGLDPQGFVKASSAYVAGASVSIPFSGMVSETEVRYSHLGVEYHSEGNPFLGTNPGDGWNAQQRFVVLDNRLFFGGEASDFIQDIGFYRQEEMQFKGEVRYLPGAYLPTFWINGGLTSRVPRGNSLQQFDQDFTQFNLGGFHQIVWGPGTLRGSLLYGFTRSKLDFTDTSSSLPSFPATITHIVNSAFQYKFRGSSLEPRFSYTFTSNGVQKPANNLVLGLQDAFLRQRLRADVNLLVGQYPKTITENDLTVGESINLSLRIREDQSVNFRERWIAYGDRVSLTTGGYYEKFF